MSNSFITNYFKKTKEASRNEIQEIVENSRSQSISAHFYENCLTQALSECQKDECRKLKQMLKEEIEEKRKKCSEHEDALNLCTEILLGKDQEIEQLQNDLEITKNVPTNVSSENVVNNKTDSMGESISATNKNIGNISTNTSNKASKTTTSSSSYEPSFSAFSNEFNVDQLSELRSIGAIKSKDPTFVTVALKFLYDGRHVDLKGKTVTGRYGRNPITPSKRTTLEKLFTERIHSLTNDDGERAHRQSRLNKHIKDGIRNIVKKHEKEEVENEACSRLAETV